MLKATTDRIKLLLGNKATLEQVEADMPTAKYDEAYDGGVIDREKFVKMLYQDLSR